MTSIIYIVPYFGKFKEDFPLWLKTCRYNSTVNWMIITDDTTEYDYPDNVKVIYSSFDDIVKKFSRLVDFPISLKEPYRLCDYKPAYGEAFAEYIEGYDFWGHCDVDLLWGNIRKFLSEDIFDKYDKIGFLGHSTLYRNTLEVNKRWRCKECSEIDYRDAFTSSENMFFDERAMNEIYEANGWDIYKKQTFADLTEYHYNFYLTNVPKVDAEKNNKQIFCWEKGNLIRKYLINRQVETDEFMYIHFLKRKMKLDMNIENNRWMIVPNKIVDWVEEPTCEFIEKNSKPHWGKYFVGLLWEKKNKITPINLVKFVIHRSKKYYALKYDNENLNNCKM